MPALNIIADENKCMVIITVKGTSRVARELTKVPMVKRDVRHANAA